MNFVKLHLGGSPVLVNLDNVTDIHSCVDGKCRIFFAAEEARVDVDESFDEIQNLIKGQKDGA